MNVPLLRQSLVEIKSCPHSYALQVIEGHKMPGGPQSARGTEIHHVMSQYINHCAKARVPADWARFDALALGAGAEAAEILNGLRDNYTVDFEHVYDTELTLSSDVGAAGGTLDVLLFLAPTKAKIEDFKSHPRPFDPKTDQSKRYPFLIFETFPEVEEVTFELVFVRYANCRRSVTYTRADYAELRQHVINERESQETIHRRYEAGEVLEAIPGKHCQYCPLLQKPAACPIAESNPEVSSDPQDWAKFIVWADKARGVAMQALKNRVDATGIPVEFLDGNGRPVQVGFTEHISQQFPLLATLPFLFEHRDTYEDDVEWIGKLLISSTKLKQYLKTKRRAITHQAIMDNAAVAVSKPKFGITLPAETDDSEPQVFEWEE